jgi:hypothetical protein
MRSLGEFVGHIAHAIRTDPNKPGGTEEGAGEVGEKSASGAGEPGEGGERQLTRRTVEEEQRDTPQGKVTLRRTIIEEVELPPGAKTPGPAGSDVGDRAAG